MGTNCTKLKTKRTMPVTNPAFDPKKLNLDALMVGRLVDSESGLVHSERDLDVTICFYQNVVKYRPARLHYLSLGLCLYAKGFHDASEWYLQEGIKGEPHALALVILAERAMTRERTGEAIDMLEESLKLKKSAVPACKLAEVYLTLKQYEMALDYCKMALTYDPNSTTVQKLMAACLLATDSPKEALVYLRKIEGIEKTSPHNFNLMGNAYKKLGRTKDSILYYQKALINSPNICFVSAHLSIAAAYFDLGDNKTMLWHLQEVTRAGHTLSLSGMGFNLLFETDELITAVQQFSADNFREASRLFKRIVNQNKKNFVANYYYACSLNKTNDADSRVYFEKAIELGQHHSLRDLPFVKQVLMKSERALAGMEETDNLSMGSLEEFEELSQDRVVNVCRPFSHNSSRIESRLHSKSEVEAV
mmetsp:Transcript_18400/g.33106  ORF Transcript_18400/g.33106 Transcript_18400/m.33106 type:complete len:420 (+) Transcript_18400:2364-3623(+)